jgi:hypothetical protein
LSRTSFTFQVDGVLGTAETCCCLTAAAARVLGKRLLEKELLQAVWVVAKKHYPWMHDAAVEEEQNQTLLL